MHEIIYGGSLELKPCKAVKCGFTNLESKVSEGGENISESYQKIKK